jgi:hypothetical protein
VIDTVPRDATVGGFNPVRHWQHSFAVAVLCERLAGEADAGVAHLVGLCHDLPKVLFHARFDAEYSAVLKAQIATGRALEEVERAMMGATRKELLLAILGSLGLPDAIRKPIEEFHQAGGQPGAGAGRMARMLRIAELYANGVLLARSAQAPVACLTQAEFRGATGYERPPTFDSDRLRGEVLALTAMLARLSPAEERELMTPLLPRRELRLWVARDPSLCPLDPVTAALASIAEVDVQPRLPVGREERAEHAMLVVLTRTESSECFPAIEVEKAGQLFGVPILWLTGRVDAGAARRPVTPVAWPLTLERLGELVTTAV